MTKQRFSIALVVLLVVNLACGLLRENPSNNFTPNTQEAPLPFSTSIAPTEISGGETTSSSNISDRVTPIVLQVLLGNEAISSSLMSLFPNQQQQEGWQPVIIELAIKTTTTSSVSNNLQASLIDTGNYTRSTSTHWGVSTGDGYLGFGSFDFRNLYSGVTYPLIVYSSIPNNQKPATLELSIQYHNGNPSSWNLSLDKPQNIPIPFDNPPTTYAPAGDTYTVTFPDAKITYELSKYFFMESRANCSIWNAAVVIPATIENTGGDNITMNTFGIKLPQTGNVNPIFVSGVDNSGNYITTDLDSRWQTVNPSGYFSPQEEKGYLAPGETAEFEVALAWLAYKHTNEFKWIWIVIQGIQNEAPVSLRINSGNATDFLCSAWPWGPKDLGK